jgi:hypothetical protein
MSTKQFIDWYALKIDSDFNTAKNSLTYLQVTSPNIYKFLVDDFLEFKKNSQNIRDTSMTLMENNANISNKIGVEHEECCTYLTNMASNKNISENH